MFKDCLFIFLFDIWSISSDRTFRSGFTPSALTFRSSCQPVFVSINWKVGIIDYLEIYSLTGNYRITFREEVILEEDEEAASTSRDSHQDSEVSISRY